MRPNQQIKPYGLEIAEQSPAYPSITLTHEVLEDVQKIGLRIKAIVDRIVGSEPAEDAKADQPQPSSNGILPQLNDQARLASRALLEAHRQLSRLDSALD